MEKCSSFIKIPSGQMGIYGDEDFERDIKKIEELENKLLNVNT